MTNAQLKALTALLSALVAQGSKKASHKAVSTYKPANKAEFKGKIASAGKTAKQLANEVAVAKAFKAKGLLVTPRVDVKTWGQWDKSGFTVKSGEKGLFVKKVGTMFHSGQVSPKVVPTKAEMTAETNKLVSEMSFPA